MAKQWSKFEFVYANKLLFSVETIIICLITQEAMTWIGCLKKKKKELTHAIVEV